jgi:hypothetical protein
MNRIKEFIVSGPGRTGGHVLAGILVAAGYPVIYTHDPLFERDQYNSYGLLICLRRDIFAAVLSNAITHKTGQSTEYKDQTIEPFSINPGEFKWMIDYYLQYQYQHDLSREYGLVEIFYFEDFVNDHFHVSKRLNIKNARRFSRTTTNSLGQQYEFRKLLTNKAPYHYTDIVINWKELKGIFDQIEHKLKDSHTSYIAKS